MSKNNQLKNFMEFVRTQGVVGLAVGLTIGTAVTVFVKSIVDSVINPAIGAMLPGSSQLSSKFVCIGHGAYGDCINKLAWGIVLSNFISFLAILVVVYVAVHLIGLEKLDRKPEAKK